MTINFNHLVGTCNKALNPLPTMLLQPNIFGTLIGETNEKKYEPERSKVLCYQSILRSSLGSLFCLFFLLIKCQSLDLMSFFYGEKKRANENIQFWSHRSSSNIYIMGAIVWVSLQQERKNDEVPFSQHDMILYIVLMLYCNFMFYWGLFDHHLKIDISRTKE